MAAAVIGSRTFSVADQTFFATLSSDRNPIHLDAMLARRTQAGAPVVHGMHTVLWCLELLARLPNRPPVLQGLEVTFLRPVFPGDTPITQLTRQTETEVRVSVHVNDLQILKLVGRSERSRAIDPMPYDASQSDRASQDRLQVPCDLDIGALSGRTGAIALKDSAKQICAAFPTATQWLGTARLEGLATLSYLVGMECPGLYSLFGGFAVDFVDNEKTPEQLYYSVADVDDRIRLAHLKVHGMGLTGKVEAFARVPPVAQRRIEEVAANVQPTEFAGEVALIVGGSRGLGEAAAKIIAAGGGCPILTYRVGAADADAVQNEIIAFGGSCSLLSYDVGKTAKEQLQSLSVEPRFVYYCATGPIFRRKEQVFKPELFAEFIGFYVDGLYALCTELLARSTAKLHVFYPSATAVEDRPRGMTEYAMAKAAAEVLCQDLTNFEPRIDILVRRLPRLVTDQTATMVPVPAQDAVSVMLPIVRELHARGRGDRSEAAD